MDLVYVRKRYLEMTDVERECRAAWILAELAYLLKIDIGLGPALFALYGGTVIYET